MKTTSLFFILLMAGLITVAESDPNAGQGRQVERLLPDCPGTPNCVSSLAEDPARRVEPFPVRGGPVRSMERLKNIIGSMPRSTIVSFSEQRMEVEFRSLLGFVDDIILVLSTDQDVIHIRSAARSGTWDLGVNRRRVERIRKEYGE